MIYIIKGQVFHISNITEYGSRIKNQKITTTIMIGDPDDERIEYIPIDFINEDIKKFKKLHIAIGDNIEVVFKLQGRKFKPENDNKLCNYLNIKAIDVKVI